MGREVTRGGDEDRRNLWVALPGEALPVHQTADRKRNSRLGPRAGRRLSLTVSEFSIPAIS
jgi:hypothetical protein